MGGCVGLRTGLGAVVKKGIFYLFPESNKYLFVVETTA
jgi:hypothetical protein